MVSGWHCLIGCPSVQDSAVFEHALCCPWVVLWNLKVPMAKQLQINYSPKSQGPNIPRGSETLQVDMQAPEAVAREELETLSSWNTVDGAAEALGYLWLQPEVAAASASDSAPSGVTAWM